MAEEEMVALDVFNNQYYTLGRGGFSFPARKTRRVNIKRGPRLREITACVYLQVTEVGDASSEGGTETSPDVEGQQPQIVEDGEEDSDDANDSEEPSGQVDTGSESPQMNVEQFVQNANAAELRRYAREHDLEVRAGMSKDELQQVIRNSLSE